jgi:hypothetical protein
MWQRRGDTVQHTLDVDVDHPVPLVNLQKFEQGLRHQSGIVDHHVDAAERPHRGIDQSLDLRVSVSTSASMRSRRRAPSTTVARSAERSRAVASPNPLLAPVMTPTLPSISSLMILP